MSAVKRSRRVMFARSLKRFAHSSDPRFARFQPTYTLPPRILRQLNAIERTCGFLSAVRLRSEWIRDVRSQTHVREALASVQIEGNSLTLEQAFELADELSEREFCNYLQAFQAIEPLHGARDERLTRGDLLNLHRTLVSGVRGGRRGAGTFRREQARVGDVVAGEAIVHHEPPPWSVVEDEVDALFDWIERGKTKGEGATDPWVHPVIQAGILQHRLVFIHPFLDGNGRTARMTRTPLLYRRGYDFTVLFESSEDRPGHMARRLDHPIAPARVIHASRTDKTRICSLSDSMPTLGRSLMNCEPVRGYGGDERFPLAAMQIRPITRASDLRLAISRCILGHQAADLRRLAFLRARRIPESRRRCLRPTEYRVGRSAANEVAFRQSSCSMITNQPRSRSDEPIGRRKSSTGE